jgi:hypothetical protein
MLVFVIIVSFLVFVLRFVRLTEGSITATQSPVQSGITDFLNLFSDWRLGNENTGNLFFWKVQKRSERTCFQIRSPSAAWSLL